MPRSLLITPSILSADLGKLQSEVESVASADWIQVDVMDGHFVQNLTFGAPVLKWIKTPLPLDFHLMVTNPADRVRECIDAGAAHITFHAEAVVQTADRRTLISAIRQAGATAGIALNPATPIEAIEDVAADVDLILIMSVVPGFGGQAFLPEVLQKVTAFRELYPDRMIQMDGGIDAKTARHCIAAGADNLVAGSAIFRETDRAAAIRTLRGA